MVSLTRYSTVREHSIAVTRSIQGHENVYTYQTVVKNGGNFADGTFVDRPGFKILYPLCGYYDDVCGRAIT
jgi:hypothetical protein